LSRQGDTLALPFMDQGSLKLGSPHDLSKTAR
jgi:hypothetical protein